MQDLLQKTQLIVHGKITSNAQLTVTVHVLDVIYNYRTGIHKGDYLKIQNDFNVVCPIDIPLEYAQQKKEAVFFLDYSKNKWRVTAGDVAFLKDGIGELVFYEEGYAYAGSIEEWKADLEGYYSHFKRNEENTLIPLLDKDAWVLEKELSALAQLQYNSYYRNHTKKIAKHPRLTLLEIEHPTIERPFETSATSRVVLPPISDEKQQEISRIIASNARSQYPELEANNIEGVLYYSLSFREDGTIAKIAIERPLHGKLHDAIRSYYHEHAKWPPALNETGQAVRFKQVLPLRFKTDQQSK